MAAEPVRAAVFAIAAALMLAIAAPAQADALDDALRAGQVGETPRGYIAPVKPPTPAIMRLVNDINARRRDEYQAIAERNGLSLQQVESVAGLRVIQRAPPGTYYQDENGVWRQK